MDEPTPFCEMCGRVGVTLTGMHPDDDGLVRWTLYRCGHVRTLVDVGASDELAAPPFKPVVFGVDDRPAAIVRADSNAV
jgi:hypothetical protein